MSILHLICWKYVIILLVTKILSFSILHSISSRFMIFVISECIFIKSKEDKYVDMRPQLLSKFIKSLTESSLVNFFFINFSLNLWKAFSNFLEATHFCQFWGNNSPKSSCWKRSFNFALLFWSRTLGRSFLQMSANATHSSDSFLFRLCDLTGKINSSQFYF